MIWVGGSIMVHGLEAYGVHFVGHVIGSVAVAAAHALPSVAVAVQWMVETFLSGVIGLLIGGISIPTIGLAIAFARKVSKRIWCKYGERN
jgi:predicted DNA repair protein MutK